MTALQRFDSPTTQTEVVTSGLTLDWLYEGRIAAFTFATLSHETVAAWLQRAPVIAAASPTGRTWYMLNDFGRAAVDFSFRDSIMSLYQRIPPNLTGFTAMVTVNPIFIQLLRNALVGIPSRSVVRDVFANRQTALKWLMMKVDRPV